MNYHKILNLIHMLVYGPLLLFVGTTRPKEKIYYYIISFAALGILLSFIYKFFTKKMYTFLYVHLFLFFPLLAYVGFYGIKDSEQINFVAFPLINALGLGAMYHHGTYFLK